MRESQQHCVLCGIHLAGMKRRVFCPVEGRRFVQDACKPTPFVFGGLLVAGLLCFAMYVGTGQVVWRRRGIVIVKWTVVAGLGFIAVLVLERLAVLL